MPMTPLLAYFPKLAIQEMRTVTLQGWEDLPDGEYGFLELYCDEAGCDCRRVLINVVAPDTGAKVWATINYGWESAGFYRRWMHGRVSGNEHAGAALDAINVQTEYSPALLRLFEAVLEDAEYVERLKRHYWLFKTAVPALGKKG